MKTTKLRRFLTNSLCSSDSSTESVSRGFRHRILRTLETASPSLTKRYEPVFIGLAVCQDIASAGFVQRRPATILAPSSFNLLVAEESEKARAPIEENYDQPLKRPAQLCRPRLHSASLLTRTIARSRYHQVIVLCY